jgi:hypothetical protein
MFDARPGTHSDGPGPSATASSESTPAVDVCLARAGVIQHNTPDRPDLVLRYALQVRGAFLKLL